MKSKYFSFGILILIIFAVIFISGCVKDGKHACPPAGFPQPPGCGAPTNEIVPYGGYTFTVTAPPNTPQHTVVFLEFPSSSWQMSKKAVNVWELKFTVLPKEKYRYNRNNWGFVAAEEFSPDSKTTYRTVEKPQKEFNDTVEKWRWFPEPGYEMPDVTTKAGEITFSSRINDERFQKGVLFVDFWWGNFADLLNTTHANLKEDKVEWIEIAPPWDYKQVNPAPVITSEE